MVRKCVPIFVLAVLSAAAATAGTTYKITDIGTSGHSLNNYGQVVGYVTGGSSLWQPSTPNGTSGTTYTFPDVALSCINSIGQLAGWYQGSDGDNHMVLWTPSTPNGTAGSFAYPEPDVFLQTTGINDLGQMCAWFSDLHLWTPETPNGPTGSSTIIDGVTWRARINNYGQIAYGTSTGKLWTPDSPNGTTGSSVTIGDLGFPEVSVTTYDINSSGQVVGTAAITDITWEDNLGWWISHAFIWTPDTPNGTSGTMMDIDPDPTRSSWAFDINDVGQVVGNFWDGSSFRAFIYADGEFTDLNSLVPADSGYTIFSAGSINDHGHILCKGFNGTETRTLLLTPATATDQVNDLKALVQTLVDLGELLPANGQPLFAKLNSAIAKLDAGDTAGAINDLQAFINQVQAFVKVGKLSAADGEALINGAQEIIDALS